MIVFAKVDAPQLLPLIHADTDRALVNCNTLELAWVTYAVVPLNDSAVLSSPVTEFAANVQLLSVPLSKLTEASLAVVPLVSSSFQYPTTPPAQNSARPATASPSEFNVLKSNVLPPQGNCTRRPAAVVESFSLLPISTVAKAVVP